MKPALRCVAAIVVLVACLAGPRASGPTLAAALADHRSVLSFTQIPSEAFATIRERYRIFYGHTSHGSQIVTGLNMLAGNDPELYALPDLHEINDDLGHTGDLSWVAPTVNWLDAHPECNVVIWSWCGGCSDNTEQGIETYLRAMSQLERQYPAVTFVYMTGHLDGTGPTGNLYRSNNQIREYCQANDKVLFDFADIESWDPAGNYYPDEDDSCHWCSDWCATHPCDGCAVCAHSHCFNCFGKGMAFWTMMTEVAGLTVSAVETRVPAADFRLVNRPNPFNPCTEIQLHIDQPGAGLLAVYDLSGNRVTTLHEGRFDVGRQSYQWSGADDRGRQQGSGVYLCRLEVGGRRQEIKMILLK